jgi:hypothetical protein
LIPFLSLFCLELIVSFPFHVYQAVQDELTIAKSIVGLLPVFVVFLLVFLMFDYPILSSSVSFFLILSSQLIFVLRSEEGR